MSIFWKQKTLTPLKKALRFCFAQVSLYGNSAANPQINYEVLRTNDGIVLKKRLEIFELNIKNTLNDLEFAVYFY
ncbi:MAG: hypothetical protein CUR32_02970 [Flavobacterium sp.]|nr:MAG: hypothetical protein CUR32_02970 [Flavobacterium sp.] [Flavobacterium sp. FEMGT703F]